MLQENRITEEEASPEEQARMNELIEQVRADTRQETMENMSAEDEFRITQQFLQKNGKKFMGSEGKFPFLSEAVNSDQEKLKRVSNLALWEIERIKVLSMIEVLARNIGMITFANNINSEKLEILKLSTSKEGMLLVIAGTEAIISKNTQRMEEEKRK